MALIVRTGNTVVSQCIDEEQHSECNQQYGYSRPRVKKEKCTLYATLLAVQAAELLTVVL